MQLLDQYLSTLFTSSLSIISTLMPIFRAKLMSTLHYLLEQHPYGLKGEGWDIEKLCANPQLPWQYIREHPEGVHSLVNGELKLVEWNWDSLSWRDGLNWRLVGDFPDKDWAWNYLSRRRDLNWSLIRELPDKPWEWYYLSRRSDLDCQLVREFPDKDWNWYILSRRSNIDWQLVRDFSDKDWNWDHLSRRSDLDWQLVRDLPDKPWDKTFTNVKDVNEVLANLDAYTTSELSSFMFDGQVSGLMTKSARSSGSH